MVSEEEYISDANTSETVPDVSGTDSDVSETDSDGTETDSDDTETDSNVNETDSDTIESGSDMGIPMDFEWQDDHLDNESIPDKEVYEVPEVQHMDDRTKISLRLLLLVQKYGISRAAHEELIDLINDARCIPCKQNQTLQIHY